MWSPCLGGNESHASQAPVAGRAIGSLWHLTAVVGAGLTSVCGEFQSLASFQEFWEASEVGGFVPLLARVR